MLRGFAYYKVARHFGKSPLWIMFTPYGPWYLLDKLTDADYVDRAWGCVVGLPFPLFNVYYVLKYFYLIYRGNYALACQVFPWNLDWQNLLLILVPPVFYIMVIKGVKPE